jgi:hypothetical protein
VVKKEMKNFELRPPNGPAKLRPPNGANFGRRIGPNSANKWAEIRPPNGPIFGRLIGPNSAKKLHQVFFISLIKLQQPFNLQQNF